jgi:cation:H+ antiporter
MSVREAVILLVLFVSQVAAEYVVILTTTSAARETELSIAILYAYAVLYVVLSVGLLWYRRDEVAGIVRQSAVTARDALGGDGGAPAEGAD